MEQTNNKVCCMCFYSFSKLYTLGKTKTVLTTLLGHHSEYYAKNLRNKAAVACWECHRVLRKMHQFLEIVNGSQETLIKAVMNLKLSKLPTLSTSFQVVIDTTQQIFEEATDNEEMSCEQTVEDETNSEAIKVMQDIAVEETSPMSETQTQHTQFDTTQQIFEEATDNEEMSCEQTDKDETNNETINVKQDIAVEETSPMSETQISQLLLRPNSLNPSSKSLLKPTSQSILKSILSNPTEPSNSFSKPDRKDLFVGNLLYYKHKEKYDLVIFNEREMYQERFEMLDRLKLALNVCKKCLKEFSSEELFAEHVNSEHRVRPDTVMCEICETYVLNTRKRLASHKRSHYVRYRCEVCDILCDSLYKLYTHMSQHGKRMSGPCKKYRCTVCHRTFDEPGNCDRHEEKVLLKNAQCNVCFKYFLTPAQCRSHMRTHTDVESLQCKVCLNWFKGHFNLMTHMKKHEKKDTEVHYCRECDVTFTNRNGLRTHLKNTIKHNQNDELRLKFICNLCDKKFAAKRAMNDHFKAIHFNNYYQCDICGKKYLEKWTIRKHMMVTHLKIQRKRDCICEKCGKGFFSERVLRDHMLVHSEDRTIRCPYCVATFKQKASRYNHIRLVHLNMKRYRSKPKKKQTGDGSCRSG